MQAIKNWSWGGPGNEASVCLCCTILELLVSAVLSGVFCSCLALTMILSRCVVNSKLSTLPVISANLLKHTLGLQSETFLHTLKVVHGCTLQ